MKKMRERKSREGRKRKRLRGDRGADRVRHGEDEAQQARVTEGKEEEQAGEKTD